MAHIIRKAIIVLLIIAGAVSVVYGLVISVYTVRVPLSGKIQTDTLMYSGMQVKLLTDVAKTLIPTVTGFVVLLASAAGYLLKQHHFDRECKVVWGIIIFALAVVSLGLWTATLTAMVNCALPFDRIDVLGGRSVWFCNICYFFGVRAMEIAIIAFFIAVDITVILAASILGGHDSAQTQDSNVT